jgi:hypothetical protein
MAVLAIRSPCKVDDKRPLSVCLQEGSISTLDLLAVIAVLVGCVVTSYCLWFYSSRYVGELSLLLPER